MSAWVEIAQAYSKVMEAQRLLETARKGVMDAPGYSDPALTDIDDAWSKTRNAADELKYMIGNAEA